MRQPRPMQARLLAVLVLAVVLPGCTGSWSAPRPNVVLVTLDTTRADRMSCYGHSRPTSPHFDALAADGARFDLAIAQSALTPVSHASIFTGLNPYSHGLRVMYAAEGFVLPDDIPTLGSVLAGQGYDTAAFLSAFPVSEYFGFARGFERFDNGLDEPAADMMQPKGNGDVGWNLNENQRRSDVTTDRAIDWLRETDAPFFMWIHYWDPHDPALLPPSERLAEQVPAGLSGDDLRRALYDAEIRWVDEQFGRLVEALRRRGLYDDTIVVVVADHGQGLGDHGWWFHRILYQEQIRIPLILRMPGAPSNVVVPDLVRSIDIYPTVLDWLGIDLPRPVDGRSLRPLILGKPDAPRLAYADQINLYDLNATMTRARPQDDLLHCAMDRRWKLIHRPLRPATSELYDLERDPTERHNVYAEHPDQVRRLRAFLIEANGFVDGPFGEGDDPEALERLRSLGYVD